MITSTGEVQKHFIRCLLFILQVCVVSQNSLAETNEKHKMVEKKIIDINWGGKSGEIGEVPGSRTGHTAGDSINPIAVDSSGNVYVGDSLNHRVQKYSKQGEFIHEIKLESQGGWPVIEDIYVESDNKIFVDHLVGSELGVYDSEGKIVSIINLKGIGVFERTGDKKVKLNEKKSFSVRKIRTDHNNNIYVLGGQLEGDLIKVNAKGKVTKRWGPDIHNFFLDEQDVLYIQKTGTVVEKYNKDGHLEGTAAQYDKKGHFIGTGWGIDANIMWPEYLDSSGYVYGISPFGRHLLTVYNLKNKKTYELPVEQDDLIEERWTVDSKGSVYITRSREKFQVFKISLEPNK